MSHLLMRGVVAKVIKANVRRRRVKSPHQPVRIKLEGETKNRTMWERRQAVKGMVGDSKMVRDK
jgi:hypothetical protein